MFGTIVSGSNWPDPLVEVTVAWQSKQFTNSFLVQRSALRHDLDFQSGRVLLGLPRGDVHPMSHSRSNSTGAPVRYGATGRSSSGQGTRKSRRCLQSRARNPASSSRTDHARPVRLQACLSAVTEKVQIASGYSRSLKDLPLIHEAIAGGRSAAKCPGMAGKRVKGRLAGVALLARLARRLAG